MFDEKYYKYTLKQKQLSFTKLWKQKEEQAITLGGMMFWMTVLNVIFLIACCSAGWLFYITLLLNIVLGVYGFTTFVMANRNIPTVNELLTKFKKDMKKLNKEQKKQKTK